MSQHPCNLHLTALPELFLKEKVVQWLLLGLALKQMC